MCCKWLRKLFKRFIKQDEETFTLIEPSPNGTSFYEILLKTESPYEYLPTYDKSERMTPKSKGRNTL